MTTHYVVNTCGERVRQQKPIVHNLIFIQLDRTVEDMKAILSDCPYPLSVYCKFDHPEQWCEIRDSDMLDLRMMCDNTFCEPVFMTSNESLMKVGRNVRITHGPLSGIHGRLIRKNKKYYIVKSFDGLGVMVTVSRWCCEPDEGENEQ